MNVSRRRGLCDGRSAQARRLRLESLEDRRMLATMLVTDLGDGSLASLAGDGQLSLREAVEAINTGAPVDGIGPTSGVFGTGDTILFQAGLFGESPQTLTLAAGQLDLTNGVNISAPVGNLLTIDAQQNSRIFDIPAGSDSFTFANLNLTGGLADGPSAGGGAIRSLTSGQLNVQSSDLNTNTTIGSDSPGGAISATGTVLIVDSSFSNNRTEDDASGGGGVFSTGDIRVFSSSFTNNRTEGASASGGALSSDGNITIDASTLSRNLAFNSSAGGILAQGTVSLTDSTVSGNQAFGNASSGGGVSAAGTITVTRSTVIGNRTFGFSGSGGGLHTIAANINVTGSIIAGNLDLFGASDIDPGSGTLTVSFSLVQETAGLGIPAATNILNQDPLLGPLSGGGQTVTHAPLPGSPVIDAGDASIAAAPLNDQRGAPFLRIANGDGVGAAVIDIGSHELQAPSVADFDSDNDVDGSDFLAWQRGFGKTEGAVRADGNSDEDADVDSQDLAVWSTLYAGGAGTAAANQTAPVVEDQVPDLMLDASIANALTAPQSTASVTENADESSTEADFESLQQAFSALPASTASMVETIAAAASQGSKEAETADSVEIVDYLLGQILLVVGS